MNLLIDIGNSNLRWTLHGDGAAWDLNIVRHSGGVPLDLLAAWECANAPERILVSNVGGSEVADALSKVTRALWSLEPEYLATRRELGQLRIAYDEPRRFGVDRWLALVAAHAQDRTPCLVVDAGTAATFDLLLSGGRHLGGLIVPGIEMMRSSLLMGTRIPRFEPEAASDPWATDTAPAVAAGSVQALAALTTRLYDRLAAEAGEPPRLLLTGGDAERLAPQLDRCYEIQADLVLRGIELLLDDRG